MPYTRHLDRLGVACLTPEARDRTCGPYWYCVDDYSTPQIAFRTRAAFLQWLDMRGLDVDELPPEGTLEYRFIRGGFSIALHMDRAVFNAIEGNAIVALQNGQYSLAKLAVDEGGRIVEHHLNPNVADRPIFDNAVCRALEDEGRATEIPPATSGVIA